MLFRNGHIFCRLSHGSPYIILKFKSMKPSKLFIAIALIIITIAAVVSTKGMKKIVAVYYYQKGTVCVFVPVARPCSPSPTATCKYTEFGYPYQAYQLRINPSTCASPLRID